MTTKAPRGRPRGPLHTLERWRLVLNQEEEAVVFLALNALGLVFDEAEPLEPGTCWSWTGQLRKGVPFVMLYPDDGKKAKGSPRTVRQVMAEALGWVEPGGKRQEFSAMCGNSLCIRASHIRPTVREGRKPLSRRPHEEGEKRNMFAELAVERAGAKDVEDLFEKFRASFRAAEQAMEEAKRDLEEVEAKMEAIEREPE
jgi:hypothetical protein